METNAEYYENTFNYRSVIYFLIKDEQVIYVGKTQKGLVRMYQHNENKDFDGVFIIDYPEEALFEAEKFFIGKYRPMYNTEYNRTKGLSEPTLGLGQIAEKYGFIYKDFIRFFERIKSKEDIPFIISSGSRHFNKAAIEKLVSLYERDLKVYD